MDEQAPRVVVLGLGLRGQHHMRDHASGVAHEDGVERRTLVLGALHLSLHHRQHEARLPCADALRALQRRAHRPDVVLELGEELVAEPVLDDAPEVDEGTRDRRVVDDDLALPLRVQEIGPVLGEVGALHLVGVVDQHPWGHRHDGRAPAIQGGGKLPAVEHGNAGLRQRLDPAFLQRLFGKRVRTAGRAEHVGRNVAGLGLRRIATDQRHGIQADELRLDPVFRREGTGDARGDVLREADIERHLPLGLGCLDQRIQFRLHVARLRRGALRGQCQCRRECARRRPACCPRLQPRLREIPLFLLHDPSSCW